MVTIHQELTSMWDERPLCDESLTDTVLEESTASEEEVLLSPVVGDTSVFDLKPSSFSRLVDWRWRLARRVLQGGLVPRTWGDKFTVAAYHFQLSLINASETDLECLAEQKPGLFAAHSLYRRGTDLLRFEVEARILAREPFDSIARKCCLSAHAITAYELLFFNVRDRLDAPGYITHFVIGPKLHEGLTPSDINVLWKFYGYHHGPHVLDALIYGQNNLQRPKSAAEVGRFFDADIQTTVAQKACIAIRAMQPGDSKAARALLRAYKQSLELKKRPKESPQIDFTVNLSVFNNDVDRMLGSGSTPRTKPDKSLVGAGKAGNLAADHAAN